ncbi:hypothetical protein HOH87_03125 [bacterium]|jgi:hypothetical protein|nr:hypothetical protein [bacterium]
MESTYIDEDEIDIGKYIKGLWAFKKQIIAVALIGMVVGGIYGVITPERYQASATFFMKDEGGQQQVGRGFSQLQSMLNLNVQNDSYTPYLEVLVKSRSFKEFMGEQLFDWVIDNNWVEFETGLDKQKKFEQVLSYLGLSNIELVQDGIVNTLKYSHENPKVPQKVTEMSVLALEGFAGELGLSAYKDTIRVLDGPVEPKNPYYPVLWIFAITGLIVAGFFATTTVLVYLIWLENQIS